VSISSVNFNGTSPLVSFFFAPGTAKPWGLAHLESGNRFVVLH